MQPVVKVRSKNMYNYLYLVYFEIEILWNVVRKTEKLKKL